MDVVPALERLRGSECENAIGREAGRVLVACLGRGLDASEQESYLRNVAGLYEGRLRVWVLDEQGRDVFHVRHRIIGTPTYILFENGVEQDRMLGKLCTKSLSEFISRTMD